MEGFFDIEKGVFLFILNLLNGLAVLAKFKIEINSYERMEEVLNILCTALTIVNDKVSNQLEKKNPKKKNQKRIISKIKLFNLKIIKKI